MGNCCCPPVEIEGPGEVLVPKPKANASPVPSCEGTPQFQNDILEPDEAAQGDNDRGNEEQEQPTEEIQVDDEQEKPAEKEEITDPELELDDRLDPTATNADHPTEQPDDWTLTLPLRNPPQEVSKAEGPSDSCSTFEGAGASEKQDGSSMGKVDQDLTESEEPRTPQSCCTTKASGTAPSTPEKMLSKDGQLPDELGESRAQLLSETQEAHKALTDNEAGASPQSRKGSTESSLGDLPVSLSPSQTDKVARKDSERPVSPGKRGQRRQRRIFTEVFRKHHVKIREIET